MNNIITHDSQEPLYEQLKELISKNIQEGIWPVGHQIPSERQLCETYNVSRTTVRKTITDLIHSNILVTVVGKGTFVSHNALKQELKPFQGFSEDLKSARIKTFSKVLIAKQTLTSSAVSQELNLESHERVIRIKRLRFVNDLPLVIQDVYLPEFRFPNLLKYDFAQESLFSVLRQQYSIELRRGLTRIKAGLASKEEATLLGVTKNFPVLRTFQVTLDQSDQPIEYCISVFHGGRYELTLKSWEDVIVSN